MHLKAEFNNNKKTVWLCHRIFILNSHSFSTLVQYSDCYSILTTCIYFVLSFFYCNIYGFSLDSNLIDYYIFYYLFLTVVGV